MRGTAEPSRAQSSGGSLVRFRRPQEGQGFSRVVLAAAQILAQTLAPALRTQGFRVTVTGSAEGVLRAGPNDVRALYLLDPLLPGMMGVDGALHELLRGPRDHRFLLLRPARPHRVEAELLGWVADDWVRRPRCVRSAGEVAAEVRTAWGVCG